jgi:hypothetical protein
VRSSDVLARNSQSANIAAILEGGLKVPEK